MGLNNYNMYGISSETENWSDFRSQLLKPDESGRRRSSSFSNIVPKAFSIDAIMQEFRLNGLDSPYDPDEEVPQINRDRIGPSSHYLRQKSWPAPEATPSVRLPRLTTELLGPVQAPTQTYQDILTEEQLRVLSSLPDDILYSLLRELEQTRGVKKNKKAEEVECKFCKNNGERAAYYRSHRLRARGRLACPVLRAYRCRRCGAHGDRAHTIKYCPLASAAERAQAAAMRSVRLASGRRRPYVDDENVLEETYATELDPIWEALEKKLMLGRSVALSFATRQTSVLALGSICEAEMPSNNEYFLTTYSLLPKILDSSKYKKKPAETVVK